MKMTSGKRAIDKIYRRRDRYDIPDWQREEVWDDQKKRLLIDSMLRRYKLPKFYFQKLSDNPEEYEVVDGQQRLSAIFEFFDDELSLGEETSDEFGGSRYSSLPEARQDALDDFEIEFDVIEDADEAEVKGFFQRLQAGLPLTSSEKLNSVHSNLRDFCRKLAKHSFFKSKVGFADKRYAHFDVVAKVAAVEIEGFDVNLRFDDLKEIFESQANFAPKSKVAKRLRDGFNFLDDIFPSKTSALRHRTVVQSIATLAIQLVAAGKAAGQEGLIRDFVQVFIAQLSKQVELGANAHDHDYVVFQRTVNANVRTGVRTRHEILMRKLFLHDASAVDLLGPAAVAESGFETTIKRSGESIAEKIEALNESYSAKHGVDLIKPTNKTASALTRLGKPITDFDQYKNLVDDLYFVFHEGPGTRLDVTPQSFRDITLLRTGVGHDVDHGKAGKAKKKKKEIGEAFKRYAGAPSPQSLDPTRFAVVQANLLASIESDIININID